MKSCDNCENYCHARKRGDYEYCKYCDAGKYGIYEEWSLNKNMKMSRFKDYPLNANDLHKCWTEYNMLLSKTDSDYPSINKIRFGQYMFNNYVQEGSWPELFYCEDHHRSFVLCLEEIEK